MKRIITLVLIVAVFISCFSVPVNAYGTEWIDVLDFYTPNNSGSNFVSLSANGVVNFSLPRSFIGYVDIVVEFRASRPSTCTFQIDTSFTKVLSVTQVNTYVYRFYGTIDASAGSGFSLKFNNSGTCTVNFLSFKMSTTTYLNINMPVSGTIDYGGGEEANFYFNSESDYSYVHIAGSQDPNYQGYRAYLTFPDWKKYDFITLQFYASNLLLSSISCNLGNQAIECDVSYISDGTSFESYLVNVFIDLSTVKRNVNDPLELIITGNTPTINGNFGTFAVFGCSGFLEHSGLNEILAFFYRLSSFLESQFNKVGNWITQSTNSIVSYLQQLVENLVPDSSAAEDAVDDAKDQASDMNDLTDQMGSMEKPDLSGTGDISGIVSPGNTVKYTLFLNRVITAPYIGEVVMLCLILSLAGYVLFGKR